MKKCEDDDQETWDFDLASLMLIDQQIDLPQLRLCYVKIRIARLIVHLLHCWPPLASISNLVDIVDGDIIGRFADGIMD